MKKIEITTSATLYNDISELSTEDKALMSQAIESRETAYAPYSKFSVGAALLLDNNKIVLGNKIGLDFNQKAVKKLNIIKVQNKSYVLATINNDHAQVYELTHLKDDYKKL